WYMAKELPDIQITVLTNSIKAAMELSVKKQITVISTGGSLLPKSLSFVGPLAESSLDEYHVNKAFISCKGLHMDRGLSESNEQQARIKKKMINGGDIVCVMADHTKLGIQACSGFGDLGVIDRSRTDQKVADTVVQQLEDNNLDLITV